MLSEAAVKSKKKFNTYSLKQQLNPTFKKI